MPQISVIVPVYNVESYLSRCVDSILEQTYTNYELLLIDDGSADRCGEIIDEYAQKDERIVVIHQENQGLSAARNTGIDIARGNYITFIDSDDYVYPKYLEKLLSSLVNNDADISICGNIRFEDKVKKDIYINFEGEKVCSRIEACKRIYEGARNHASYVTAWGKLYKKELFNAYRYPIRRLHEDQFLTYKLIYFSEKIVEIGECLYAYFENMQGIMNSSFRIKRYDNIEALEEAEYFYLEHNERILAEIVQRKREEFVAEYSIRARNSGIYNMVPTKYKMSFYEAKKIIKKLGGIDRYEYIMFPYYPRLVTFEARIRKLRKLIKI